VFTKIELVYNLLFLEYKPSRIQTNFVSGQGTVAPNFHFLMS